jgi:hypothetical protein
VCRLLNVAARQTASNRVLKDGPARAVFGRGDALEGCCSAAPLRRLRRPRRRWMGAREVRFCRCRFSATDELKYRGARRVRTQCPLLSVALLKQKLLIGFIESQTKLLWN